MACNRIYICTSCFHTLPFRAVIRHLRCVITGSYLLHHVLHRTGLRGCWCVKLDVLLHLMCTFYTSICLERVTLHYVKANMHQLP